MTRDHQGYAATMSRNYDDDFDAAFGGPDRGDIGFFCTLAAAADGPICEVGAGTGRVLLPVARAVAHANGARPVLGVEPSAHMRARLVARIDAARDALGDGVAAADGTFTAIPCPDGSQALVYTAFRSFQHVLDVDEQLAGLAEIRRVLRPGGVVALDFFDPDYGLLCDLEPTLQLVTDLGGGREVERWEARRLDRLRQCVEVTYRWVERGATGDVVRDERATYVVRYTFPWELVHLLARAGFALEHLYGDYDRSPVGAAPRELIVIARAPTL